VDWTDEAGIAQQINRRRAAGEVVCVQITIDGGGLNLFLTTPTCGGMGGGGRIPNSEESRVISLWSELGLDKRDFSGGNVIAFLKRLRRMAA
jgi:hypothetical protein